MDYEEFYQSLIRAGQASCGHQMKGLNDMDGKIAGIILAGGKSSRYGEPKAFAIKNGLPFFQYSVQALEPICKSLVLVTNPTLLPLFYEANVRIPIVTDEPVYSGHGPLAGIYTGIKRVLADWYIVTPIDVPFINDKTITKLLTYIDFNYHAIVPIVNGQTQPLIAIYHSSVFPIIKEQLDEGRRSLHDLLDQLNVMYISIEAKTPFININNRTDYINYIDREVN